MVYDDFYDARYDAAGQLDGSRKASPTSRASSSARFHQKTNALVVKGSFVQPGLDAPASSRSAARCSCPRVEFGTPGYLDVPDRRRRGDPGPPRQRAAGLSRRRRLYFPVIAAAFVQDQIEWNDLTVRAGRARRRTSTPARASPSDLANPANAIAGAPPVGPRADVDRSASVSPRIGVVVSDRDRAGDPLRVRALLPVPADRADLPERRLLDPRGPAGQRGRHGYRRAWAIPTSSPR